MDRAFVALSIKAVDDETRQIEGWASRVEEDRVGDIVMPRGVSYELPIPFLLDHDHRLAVGEVDKIQITDDGIKFWAHIKKIAEPGEVKDLTDKAWALVKNGLRRAVSIGFKPKEFEALPTGGLKFTSWEWLELSAVSVPAAPGAKITGTKSYAMDDKFVAEAPVDPEIPQPQEPAAIGKTARVVKLDAPARARANPFIIRDIKRT